MLSSLFTRPLRISWSFACGGSLWRLLFSERGRIVGECRDSGKKETEFFSLDARSGVPLWRFSPQGERWWIGLEAVRGERVLLHGFETPDLPEHKQIVALDLESGEEVWRRDDLTYWFGYQSRLYAYRSLPDKRTGVVLDLESGRELEAHESVDAFGEVRSLARREEAHDEIDFPEAIRPDDATSEVRMIVRSAGDDRERVGDIEMVQKGRFAVLNYHRKDRRSSPEDPRLENRLLIVDLQNGKNLFSETLLRDARVPVPDAFFMKDRSVFFIKNQRELSMIELPGVS